MKIATLGATLALSGVLAAAASSATARPSIRLLDSSPVTVKGLAFKPLERVRVTATIESTTLRATVRATRRGAFTVRFAGTSLRCSFAVEAVGGRGSRASLKLPQPACPPPLAPP